MFSNFMLLMIFMIHCYNCLTMFVVCKHFIKTTFVWPFLAIFVEKFSLYHHYILYLPHVHSDSTVSYHYLQRSTENFSWPNKGVFPDCLVFMMSS